MPILESKEELISMLLEEEKRISQGTIYLFAIAGQLKPELFPLDLEDKETLKKLYEHEKLTVDEIHRLTKWSPTTIYRYLRAMNVKLDRRRQSKVLRELNLLKAIQTTLYFKTDLLKIELTNCGVQITTPAGPYKVDDLGVNYDLSSFIFIRKYLDYDVRLFYSLSKQCFGLTVDGFMAKYSQYVEKLLQKTLRPYGLTDVKLVPVE